MEANVTLYAERNGSSKGCQFDISKGNVCCWRNDHNFIFYCKATTENIRQLETGRNPYVWEAVSHFEIEHTIRRIAFHTQPIQLKVKDTPHPFDRNFKAVRSWCN